MENISVFGLGKLGACYAAFYARHGHRVVGFDNDSGKMELLAKGQAPVSEPGLQEYLNKSKSRLSIAKSVEDAVLTTDVSFVIVPTPSNKNGFFSVDYATSVARSVGSVLAKKSQYHLFVIVSTVLPGDSRERIIPVLERASGKKCGKDFGYAYSPSLIAIGDILNNLENPDLLFLGAFDKKSEAMLSTIYGKVYKRPNIRRMSIESAELAKIALNSYVTMKISFSNNLALLADRIENTNVDDVTGALGSDARIGAKYLRAGLGYGGPCFPRDNRAFAAMARRRGVSTPLAIATDKFNNTIVDHMANLLIRATDRRSAKIGFLGISYKPRTTLAEDSQALSIAKKLKSDGYSVVVYEPINDVVAQQELPGATFVADVQELVKKSDVIFVSNADPAFNALPGQVPSGRKLTIVDPWGMFLLRKFPQNCIYVTPGRGMMAAVN